MEEEEDKDNDLEEKELEQTISTSCQYAQSIFHLQLRITNDTMVNLTLNDDFEYEIGTAINYSK